MTYIGECRAPELSSIGTPVGSKYMLNCVFCGAGTADRTAASYVIIYILAVDKAVREYTSERELLVQYAASENRTMLLLVGLGHFETCINSVKRALRCVDRLARYPLGPDVDREIRRVLASYTQSVTPLRRRDRAYGCLRREWGVAGWRASCPRGLPSTASPSKSRDTGCSCTASHSCFVDSMS